MDHDAVFALVNNHLREVVIQDDVILRLMSFPNVLITAHQGFLTEEALTQIALVTIQSVDDFEAGKELVNKVERCSENSIFPHFLDLLQRSSFSK
jgi:phosphoglycerate dehydrogenase-like enzyme